MTTIITDRYYKTPLFNLSTKDLLYNGKPILLKLKDENNLSSEFSKILDNNIVHFLTINHVEDIINPINKVWNKMVKVSDYLIISTSLNIHTNIIDSVQKLIIDAKYQGIISTQINNIITPYLIIKKVKLDPKDFNLNPPLKVIPYKHKNISFNLIQDGELIGGTKQRMLAPLISSSKCTEFVYAGPVYGYAQVALSNVAKIFGKQATLFIEKMRPRWSLTKFASTFGPKIIEIEQPAPLKLIQQRAEEYVKSQNLRLGPNHTCLVSFGLNQEKDLLEQQIRKALTPELKTNPPKRIWMVAGSATVLQVLYRIFPKTHFVIVQVGKKIWPDQLELHRTKLIISDEKFVEAASIQPPYPTVRTYDAKLWKYFMEEGENGDFIWNIGVDVLKPRFDEYIYDNIRSFQENLHTIKFPYYRTFIPLPDIKNMVKSIKEYDYRSHILSPSSLGNSKDSPLIITNQTDKMHLDVFVQIACEKCMISSDTKNQFLVDKLKLGKRCLDRYQSITPYYLRKFIKNRGYYLSAALYLTIDQFIKSKINNRPSIRFLNLSPRFGEALAIGYVSKQRLDVVVDDRFCSANNYLSILDYLNRTISLRHNIRVFNKLHQVKNQKYNVIILESSKLKELNDLSLIDRLLFNQGYLIILYETQKLKKPSTIPNFDFVKEFIFSNEYLQYLTIAHIFSRR